MSANQPVLLSALAAVLIGVAACGAGYWMGGDATPRPAVGCEGL